MSFNEAGISKSLVLFGDSLLARMGIDTISNLEILLEDAIVYNCAAGGMTSNDGAKRADFIAKLQPDDVVLSFGTNDCAPWKVQVSKEDFRKNLLSIIHSFSGSRVIIFPCPPAYDPNDLSGTKEFNAICEQYNEIIFDIAKSTSSEYINSPKIYGDLLKNGTNYHEEDGIHLNEKGYEVLVLELSKIIT